MTGARRLESAVALSGILLLLTVGRVEAQTVDAPRCGTGVHEAQATGTVGFPEDQIFCPLLADPKEARSFVSFLHGNPARLIMLLLEMYEGPSPYGQFFQDDISYIGVGIHFSL
jgi:uncharacterized protein DUF1207